MQYIVCILICLIVSIGVNYLLTLWVIKERDKMLLDHISRMNDLATEHAQKVSSATFDAVMEILRKLKLIG